MRSGIAVGKESVRVSLVVRAGLRRTVMRRAKIVMVCCARVMMGKLFVSGSVFSCGLGITSLRKVVELFESFGGNEGSSNGQLWGERERRSQRDP